MMFRIHLEFMLNRRSSLLLIVAAAVIISFYYYYGNMNLGYEVLDGNREHYFSTYVADTVFFLEFFLLFIASFTSIQSYSQSASGYAVYLICSRKTKLAAILTKTAAVVMVNLIFVYGQLLAFYLLSRLLTPFPLTFAFSAQIFAGLFIEMVFFSFLQSLLMLIVNNYLTSIIPIALFWIMAQHDTIASIKENQTMIVLNTLIPNLVMENRVYTFYANTFVYMIVLFALVGLITFIYMNKDI